MAIFQECYAILSNKVGSWFVSLLPSRRLGNDASPNWSVSIFSTENCRKWRTEWWLWSLIFSVLKLYVFIHFSPTLQTEFKTVRSFQIVRPHATWLSLSLSLSDFTLQRRRNFLARIWLPCDPVWVNCIDL